MAAREKPKENNVKLPYINSSAAISMISTLSQISDESGIENFYSLLKGFGSSEMWTCFFATFMGIPYAFHVMSYVFTTFPYEHECVPNTIDKCDPSCTKIIFPSARNVTNIISEWKLVCENQYKRELPHYIFLIGSMIGNILFGHWADQHGRRPCILCTSFMMVISGLIAGSTPWFWLYCFIKFFIGFSTGGWIVCCMVFLVEFVSVRYREIVILTADVPYCIGYCILPAVAYFLPNWRHIQLLTSALGCFSVAYIWVLPESPRWLLLTGRIKQCANVIQTSSRNKELPRRLLLQIISKAHYELRAGQFAKTGYFFDIFITKQLRKMTFIFGIVWFTLFMVTFNVLFHSKYLGDYLYVEVAIFASIMMCGNLVSFPIIRPLNRRTVHAFAYTFTAFWMFVSTTVPKFSNPYMNDLLQAISVLLVPLAFYNLLIFSTELYPTVLRTSGIGFGFCCAQIGVCITSLVKGTASIKAWLPPVISGSLALMSAGLIFLLPETKSAKLKDKLKKFNA